MDGIQFLQVASLVVGVGVPTFTLVFTAGKTAQRLKTIEDSIKKREKAEKELDCRLTEVEEALAYQKGLLNGAKL
jgi:hypothetical protein